MRSLSVILFHIALSVAPELFPELSKVLLIHLGLLGENGGSLPPLSTAKRTPAFSTREASTETLT